MIPGRVQLRFEDGRVLTPSDRLDGIPLPFGDPPAGLAEEGTPVPENLEDLALRVRSLVSNAEAVEAGDPQVAAACLHEAGRLLDRRLGLRSQSWICHSRALSLSSDYRQALHALLRLARLGGDRSLLQKVLDAHLDSPQSEIEERAVSTERTTSHVANGSWADALDATRDAARTSPDNAVCEILKLGLASREGDDEELVNSLGFLAREWPGRDLQRAARLLAALVEERAGGMDSALARLEPTEGEEPSLAESWLRARLLMRTGRDAEGLGLLEELLAGLGEDLVSTGLRRWIVAARSLAGELQGDDAGTMPWDLGLTVALRSGSFGLEEKASVEASRSVSDPRLRAALSMGASAARLVSDEGNEADLSGPDIDPPWREALDAFSDIDTRPPLEEVVEGRTGGISRSIVASLTLDNPAQLDRSLSDLADMVEGDQPWDLAVARALVRCHRLDRPMEGAGILRAVQPDLSRAPLASMLRIFDRSSASLAAVALAEASRAENDVERSWLLSWAGAHLEGVSSEEAARLHREALDLNPTCSVSLAALEREGTDNLTMASVLVAAAKSSRGDEDRGLNLLRAAIRYYVAGAHERALETLEEVHRLMPGDRSVRRILIRLALGRSEGFDGESLLFTDPPEGIPFWESMALGSLGLAVNPSLASRWFAAGVDARPEDPSGLAGLSRARLTGGRKSEESSRLLDILRGATTTREEAWVYMRLADIDARYGNDPASAALSLMSVQEKLPGHRSTLGRVAVYLARKGRKDDLTSVMAALAASLEDDADGAFAANEAWRGSVLDLDIIRLAMARNSGSAYAAARLEAYTSVPQERTSCLRVLSSVDSPARVHVSRLADALEDSGETREALDLRFSILEEDPGSLFDLLGTERKMREIEDYAGLEKTLVRLAEATDLHQYKIERLLESSKIAQEKLDDQRLAARHCLEVLRLDPSNDEAFARGRRILESGGDPVLLDRFFTARIGGIDDAEEKLTLLDDLATVRIEAGSREEAKESIRQALELSGGDVKRHRWLSSLHVDDSEWDMAIDHLVEAAKKTGDPASGVEIFFDLGVLYMDHGERPDLAEKSFVKVLGWDRGHFPAMERLSVLYEKTGNWQRCAQALEHLVKMTDDVGIKVAKTVELARILESGMGRTRDAESVLSEIRRVAPLDIRPVEFLAGMFTRQRDAMALNVLLDQSLATNALAVVESPGDAALFGNIYSILKMKTEDEVASMAWAVLGLLGAPLDDLADPPEREARWNVGARIGDGALEGFLCPKQAPPGLRATMKAVEEPLARMLGIGVKSMGLGKDSRLDRKHPLSVAIASMSAAFGLRGEPAVYSADVREILVVPGPPHSIVMPLAAGRATEEEVLGYLAGYSLMVARSGLSLATLLDDARLTRVIASLVKVSVPAFNMDGLDPRALEAEAASLRQGIPSKLLAHIQPFAFDCSTALENTKLKEIMLSAGLRAGFLGAGSMSGAIRGLAISHGASNAPVAQLPGIGRLLTFVFGKDHLELRRKMGI